MATLDRLTRKAREWQQRADESSRKIQRAATVQARQYELSDPGSAARTLAATYGMLRKPGDWREYGDVALHLVAAWPPDLAYLCLYGLREMRPELGYDPVPLVLKAVEMLYHLDCGRVELRLEPDERVGRLLRDPEERARGSAKIIAREISVTPLRWASGIFNSVDPDVRPFVREQLVEFNPTAARILAEGTSSRFLTWNGLVQAVFRLLFGRE
jgi:hypothetical protein